MQWIRIIDKKPIIGQEIIIRFKYRDVEKWECMIGIWLENQFHVQDVEYDIRGCGVHKNVPYKWRPVSKSYFEWCNLNDVSYFHKYK